MGGRPINRVITIPYLPRPLQKYLHSTLKRFNVIVSHRRFGKTIFAINHLIKDALTNADTNPRYGYIAPLYRQAKSISWDYLKYYTNVIPGIRYNEAELRCDFPNGARISLYGADNPDSLRGLGFSGTVLDEVAQMKDSLWGEVIRPTLADRLGWSIFIGTPKGLDGFYDLYESAGAREDWYRVIYKASETDIIPEEELLAARQTMSYEQYMREFECSFTVPTKHGFDKEWLRYWDPYNFTNLNRYILVDSANEKKANSDYTAMIVVGIGDDDNYYIIDIVRERLNLTERAQKLLQLHRKYRPLGVAYEKYGKDSDIQHIEYIQVQENYRFTITPVGGSMKKEDRIRTLIPLFENERVYLPHNILAPTGTGMMRDVAKEFVNEYLSFPVGKHDDMLDCLARINDPNFIMKSPTPKLHRHRDRKAKTAYAVI